MTSPRSLNMMQNCWLLNPASRSLRKTSQICELFSNTKPFSRFFGLSLKVNCIWNLNWSTTEIFFRLEISIIDSDVGRHRFWFCSLFQTLSTVVPCAFNVTMNLRSFTSILNFRLERVNDKLFLANNYLQRRILSMINLLSNQSFLNLSAVIIDGNDSCHDITVRVWRVWLVLLASIISKDFTLEPIWVRADNHNLIYDHTLLNVWIKSYHIIFQV